MRRPVSLPLPLAGLLLVCACASASAQSRVLDERTHHLRRGARPEWSEFARSTAAPRLDLEFVDQSGTVERTLVLRQEDVKQRWRVVVNGQAIGMLHQDENPLVAYWPIPAGVLVRGANRLRVEPVDTVADDIRVGAIELLDRPLPAVLSQATVEVELVDADGSQPLPGRITVTDAQGRLQMVGAASGGGLAVRPGFVYTGSGHATFGLPAGSYRIYGSRGFEYGVDSIRVVLRPGDRLRRRLAVRREVPTAGWVASDTHVHSLTHSGHGDATAEERVLTLAGEGVELPIITEHNVQVDLDSVARAAGVRRHFTPVVGNELTTRIGHFNLFPLSVRTPAPDARADGWDAIRQRISAAGAQVAILNHGRDVHAGFRPLGPDRHLAVAGFNRDGWVLPANAMEVVNSGAQQTDPLRLLHDWFGMLNGGHPLTPAGSSDSHDVGRYLVGQARTYIRTEDREPGGIDLTEAVSRFRAGAVMVSFGLLAEIRVDGRYGPGDLAPGSEPTVVRVRVLGPGWTRADRVSLYANGRLVHTARIPDGRKPGVKWSATWRLPRLPNDAFLVAVAEGPGDRLPFWPIAKPYQPTSPDWNPRVIGASGAVWLDADGDGQRTPAQVYARRLVDSTGGRPAELVAALAGYDEAVATQAAALLLQRGITPSHPELTAALRTAAPATRRGFDALAREWLQSEAQRGAGR